uniref:Uncharacterized protein n=1 Tax=Rhizophora mucronata TaxID=61149 RepID=A0A2P2P835_RHIMU
MKTKLRQPTSEADHSEDSSEINRQKENNFNTQAYNV